MMNRLFVLTCALMWLTGALCDENAKYGGTVKLAGKGKIAIVDCSAGVDWKIANKVFEAFDKAFHVELIQQRGDEFSVEKASDAVLKTQANAAVFVGFKPNYPIAIASSEQKWSFVNVAPLKADGRNFVKRFRIMLMRGIYRAIGSDASQAANSTLSPIHSLTDLDKITDLDVAMDTYVAVCQSFDSIGIVPSEYGTYQDACEMGIAPAPTNDIQRAIWEKVHAIPDKPITINFDPKKDK